MRTTLNAYALLSGKLDEIRIEANRGIHGEGTRDACLKIYGLIQQAQQLLRENLVLSKDESAV
ncbi:MAG: hypothetical protein ACTTH8_07200 [Treponema sp.]